MPIGCLFHDDRNMQTHIIANMLCISHIKTLFAHDRCFADLSELKAGTAVALFQVHDIVGVWFPKSRRETEQCWLAANNMYERFQSTHFSLEGIP